MSRVDYVDRKRGENYTERNAKQEFEDADDKDTNTRCGEAWLRDMGNERRRYGKTGGFRNVNMVKN